MNLVYLDNSATSWPKPPAVIDAVCRCMQQTGGNPGRSGHAMSLDAARLIFNAREQLASFFGLSDSQRLVFTSNATHAINIALKGLLNAGDSVSVSGLEHNSVMRPLRNLEQKIGIKINVLKANKFGILSDESFLNEISEKTKLLVVSHASNVTGALQPLKMIGAFCRKKNITFMVDSAQTAGLIPIHIEKDFIDILTFTGHKSMLGPQGIGGICIGKNIQLESLLQGGTGSNSELEVQPEFLPDSLESGTPNTPGIAGLAAGVNFINEIGIENIHEHEISLAKLTLDMLSEIKEVKVYGPDNSADRTGTISFNVVGINSSTIGHKLDKEFSIMTRTGLHCSPLAHKTTGTYPGGTVRLSPGFFTTKENIIFFIESLKSIIFA
ncbi:MAG: aminotransferase class V-fold PLP-dependent enzyme [Candidatus Riflebacteria bacterium]|nr:aminotransferase class V-fold PLP-dependent enzyme [Candidatus Riflebacteria bacterium]